MDEIIKPMGCFTMVHSLPLELVLFIQCRNPKRTCKRGIESGSPDQKSTVLPTEPPPVASHRVSATLGWQKHRLSHDPERQ